MGKKGEKMSNFKDFLKEQFEKDKDFEKGFYQELEKARIAVEIASFREQAGLTQKELAQKVGTSQSAIARMENAGYQNYSLRTLRKIAEVLDLELVVSLREKGKDKAEVPRLAKLISLPGYGERRSSAGHYSFDDLGKYEIPKKIVGG